ncbi:MAG: peptide deformylase [Phycisphaerae bacterium]|nr:peptide deformylase [Phycisphaerae bacterium]
MKAAVGDGKDDIGKTIREPLQLEIYPGSQVLRQTARSVEVFGDDVQILAAQMLDYMRQNKGIGLAAPQIGLSRRIIVAEVYNDQVCIVNPRIVCVAEWDWLEEGCLSLPGKSINVKRRRTIEVEGMDVKGNEMSVSAAGIFARVLQHEIDHLNGVLICDYELRA